MAPLPSPLPPVHEENAPSLPAIQTPPPTPPKLLLGDHTIQFAYLGNPTALTLPASSLLPPAALRRYRHSQGRFTLSWRMLLAYLADKCNFDPAQHVLVYSSRAEGYLARLVEDQKALNRAYREMIGWFKESEGGREVVFWALRREEDLEVRFEGDVEREEFLREAGGEIEGEDFLERDEVVENRARVEWWSEGVDEGGWRVEGSVAVEE